MTNEELKNMPAIIDTLLDDAITDSTKQKVKDTLTEVCKLAIKTLEQHPNEDCISREAVNVLVDELARAISDERIGISRGRSTATIMRDMLHLPSVKPERPKGKWIFCYGNRGKDNVEKCSCCKSYWKEAVIYRYDTQEYLRLRLKYCPKCGAEMEGEEDANNN